MAISLVDNTEFRSLLGELHPRYPVPGRNLVGKRLDKLISEMKGNILSTAQRLSLCADIWSKDHHKCNVTFAVTKFPNVHTGECVHEVVEEVLKEWDIPVKEFDATLTDNCSNMVKAFRAQVLSQVEGDDEDDLEEDENVSED